MYLMPPHLIGPPILNTEKKRPQKVLKIEIFMFILMHLIRDLQAFPQNPPALSPHTILFFSQL